MCFEIIAKINQIDVDLRKITKEYAIDETELPKEELVRIIKQSDFKVKIKKLMYRNTGHIYNLSSCIIYK